MARTGDTGGSSPSRIGVIERGPDYSFDIFDVTWDVNGNLWGVGGDKLTKILVSGTTSSDLSSIESDTFDLSGSNVSPVEDFAHITYHEDSDSLIIAGSTDALVLKVDTDGTVVSVFDALTWDGGPAPVSNFNHWVGKCHSL